MIFMEGGRRFLWLMSSLFEDSMKGSTALLRAVVLMAYSFLVLTLKGCSRWHGKHQLKPSHHDGAPKACCRRKRITTFRDRREQTEAGHMRKKWQTHNMYVHVRPPVHVHMHAVVFRVSVLAHASLLTTIFHQLA